MLIPPGFNTVTAYFFVAEADVFLTFLTSGLGGVEILRHMNGSRIESPRVWWRLVS